MPAAVGAEASPLDELVQGSAIARTRPIWAKQVESARWRIEQAVVALSSRVEGIVNRFDRATPRKTNTARIVVVKHAGEHAGLVVDALRGEFQTVIKPLGKLFSNVACVSSSSI